MAKRDSAPRRYAEAAFQLATRDGSIETWRGELEQAAAVTDGELMDVLGNPALPLDERLEVTNRVFADLSQPDRNILFLLVRRHRIEQLPRVVAEFIRLDERRQGIIHANATSAAPLTDL